MSRAEGAWSSQNQKHTQTLLMIHGPVTYLAYMLCEMNGVRIIELTVTPRERTVNRCRRVHDA